MKNKILFFIQKYLGGKFIIAIIGFFPYLFFKLFSPLLKFLKLLSKAHIQEKIFLSLHRFGFLISLAFLFALVGFFFQNSQKLNLTFFSLFEIEIELFFFALIIFFIGYVMGYFTNYFSLIIAKIKNKVKQRKINKLSEKDEV